MKWTFFIKMFPVIFFLEALYTFRKRHLSCFMSRHEMDYFVIQQSLCRFINFSLNIA